MCTTIRYQTVRTSICRTTLKVFNINATLLISNLLYFNVLRRGKHTTFSKHFKTFKHLFLPSFTVIVVYDFFLLRLTCLNLLLLSCGCLSLVSCSVSFQILLQLLLLLLIFVSGHFRRIVLHRTKSIATITSITTLVVAVVVIIVCFTYWGQQ